MHVITGRPHRVEQPSSRPRDLFLTIHQCHATDSNILQLKDMCLRITSNSQSPPIFLFYDANAMEGFNLRRDVYIRMAVFVRTLRQTIGYENAILVLPPFHQLYHWQLVQTADELQDGDIVPWSHFFDLSSMRQFTEVIDLWQYFDLMRNCFGHPAKLAHRFDYVFKLNHFESMFMSGHFEEKFQVSENCSEANLRGVMQQFIGLYSNITISKLKCVEFQGSATLLADLLKLYPKT